MRYILARGIRHEGRSRGASERESRGLAWSCNPTPRSPSSNPTSPIAASSGSACSADSVEDDRRQAKRIVFTGEADGLTCCTHARRSSHAMHIIFSKLWQIEVNYMTHLRNVQAARGHIRCYQNVGFTTFKVRK